MRERGMERSRPARAPARDVDGDTRESKLREMKILRRRPVTLALVMTAAMSCERGKVPPRTDSATVSPSGGPADSSKTAAGSGWDTGAGPLLLVAGDSADHALVVAPDSANAAAEISAIPHPASVTLFSRNGSVQLAELPSVTDTSGCPVATLSAAPPPHAWKIGFLGGVVASIPVDSTESLSPTDSAALVSWMDRLASTLPNDPGGRFAGLPFVVRSLWRFTIPNGPQMVVATLKRQINQEASPIAEHTFLMAQHAANDTTYDAVYSERSYGEEETIESTDVLAGALLGSDRTPAIVIARDFGDAMAYSLLERDSTGKWHVRWTSARRHC